MRPKPRQRYFSWSLVKAGTKYAHVQCDCGTYRRFVLSVWNAGDHLTFRCARCLNKSNKQLHTWLFSGHKRKAV